MLFIALAVCALIPSPASALVDGPGVVLIPGSNPPRLTSQAVTSLKQHDSLRSTLIADSGSTGLGAGDAAALTTEEGLAVGGELAIASPLLAGGTLAVGLCYLAHGCFLFDRQDPPWQYNGTPHYESRLDSFSIPKDGVWTPWAHVPTLANALRGHAFYFTDPAIYQDQNPQCNGGPLTPSTWMVLLLDPATCLDLHQNRVDATFSMGVFDVTPTVTYQPSDTLPPGYTNKGTWPAVGDNLIAQSLGQGFDNLPTVQGQRIVNEIGHQIAPAQYPNPYTASAAIPDCSGLLYSACVSALGDAGFTNVSRSSVSFDDADTSKPADAVLSTSPSAGTTTGVYTQITVRTNPPTSEMPVVVPDFAPAPGEDADTYIQTLSNLGLRPQQVNSDSGFDPGNVDGTDPKPGTRMLPGGPIKVDTRTADRNRCEDHAAGRDPAPERGTTVHDPRLYDDAPSAMDPGTSQPTLPTVDGRNVHLRYGWARESDAVIKGYPVLFDGWGWRHIYAKHGWDQSDVESTAQALAHPIDGPTRNSKGNLDYLGLQFKRNGRLCQRLVAVDDQSETLLDGSHASRDIVTSFLIDEGSADAAVLEP